MANSISEMSLGQLGWPVVRSSYSALAGVDERHFLYLYSRLIGVTFYIVLPCAIFLFFFWNPAIDMLLGEQWSEIHDFGSILTLDIIFAILIAFNRQILLIKGHEKENAFFTWAQALILAPALVISVKWGIYIFVLTRLFASALFFFFYTVWTKKHLGFGLGLYFSRALPIVTASIGAIGLAKMVAVDIGLAGLLLSFAAFIIALVFFLWTLGFVVKSNHDVEKYILGFLKSKLRRVML